MSRRLAVGLPLLLLGGVAAAAVREALLWQSQDFTLAELTSSSTADRHGLSNQPGPLHLVNLRRLAIEVLQPLRDALGRPVTITSGYRSPALQRAMLADGRYSPSATSHHLEGRAADLVVQGRSSYELAALVLDLGLPVQEVIAYAPARGGHLHVAYDGTGRAPRVMTAPASGGYVMGLPARAAS